MKRARQRPQPGADRASSVFLPEAGPPAGLTLIQAPTLPSSADSASQKTRLSPAEVWQIMLFVPTHTWCLQKYFQGLCGRSALPEE